MEEKKVNRDHNSYFNEFTEEEEENCTITKREMQVSGRGFGRIGET